MSAVMLQVLPALTEAEYTALRESIREHGVLVPLVFDERGDLLDGHHRLKACDELGVKNYPSEVVPCADDAERRTLARSLNCQRRHLTQDQRRALIADQLHDTPHWADNRIAGALGVDGKTVAVVRSGLEATSEIPKLTWREGGDGKVRPARRPIVLAKNKRDRDKALTIVAQLDETTPGVVMDVRRAEFLSRQQRRAANGAAEADSTIGTARLLIGDMRERGAEIADASVDLIFTDPPYAAEFLPLYSDLGVLAARVLKPTAFLVCYHGNQHFLENCDMLRAHLRLHVPGALYLPGAHGKLYEQRVWTRVRPLTFWTRQDLDPEAETPWFESGFISEGYEKEAHPHQQSIGCPRYYIERFTKPGDLIVDPFLGGGTTACAAVELGRHFIGIEVDAQAFATAEARIAAVETGAAR